MPIHYNINSELNIVIYVCRGEVTAMDLFNALDRVLVDPHRKLGLISIYDLFFATENIPLEDMYKAIQRLEQAAEPGSGVGPRVLLTRSQGIHLIVETMRLIPKRLPIQIDAYDTIEDAIIALRLKDSEQGIISWSYIPG